MVLIQRVLRIFLVLTGAIAGGAGIALLASGLQLQSWKLAVIVALGSVLSGVGVLAAFFGAAAKGKSQVGRIGLEGAIDILQVLEGPSPNGYRVATIRQSGSEARIEHAPDAASAAKFLRSTFRRKQLSEVRIWKNSPKLADVRVPIYHGRGTREGRVIGGVTIRRL